MAAFLLRFLPHGLVIMAVLGAVWWLDHEGYRRARKDMEQERLVTALMITRAARESEGRLSAQLAEVDRRRADSVARLGALHTTVFQPTIEREITREARFRDPAAGLSDGLREAINRTLAAVACTARADGGIDCALPAAAADRIE